MNCDEYCVDKAIVNRGRFSELHGPWGGGVAHGITLHNNILCIRISIGMAMEGKGGACMYHQTLLPSHMLIMHACRLDVRECNSIEI